ncbi:TrlF family AAA-like ATPase [Kaistella faecalis]|uniref:TrlF family AAA-like ATPase n=1 Tax=Kaistella faecalis TaxID=2852098 RepID=UPI003133AC67
MAIGKTEWDKLQWTDASIAQKKSIINSANIVFTAAESIENYNKAKEKLNSQNVNDFLFDCSDAHSFSTETSEKDRVGNCLNWLKSDISFHGLKQVLIEKESRLFVGDKPNINLRVNTNRTKYIESITINQVTGYDESSHGVWFRDIEIPLNPELVAIIGNKGNGKSALADIIGLCGDYNGRHDDFSFLNKKKFGENSGRISQNFEAKLKWLSGAESVKNLNHKTDSLHTEKVKYLPQGYFESITNESVEDFNKEIENVVFTHLEEDEKLGKTNFKELIDYKNSVSKEEIILLKGKLHSINESILNKEIKLNPLHQNSIEEHIKQRQDELDALIEPIAVTNPNDDPDHAEQNKNINDEVEELTNKINQQEDKIKATEELKGTLLIELNELKSVKQRIVNKIKEVVDFKNSLASEISKYENLDIDQLITVTSNLETLETLLSEKNMQYEVYKLSLDESISTDPTYKSEKAILKEYIERKEEIQKSLGEADKIYQHYLLEKKNWEDLKNKIIGTPTTHGTLEFYKKELNYLNTNLTSDIETDKIERLRLTKEIFDLKTSVLSTYQNVKQRIDNIICENNELLSEYPIEIEASFTLTSSFQKRFLDFISFNKAGTFYGKENAELQFRKLIENADISIFDGVSKLLENLVNPFFTDLREPEKKTYIENQVNDVVDLYDYLFSLDFVDYNYELRQGNKNLDQLSPGEKGALLLIFYLLLDNNDIPLIIDQPEDNLDNHSVANILVPFIKKAKSKRQIILVTHNPNLAVVADAEQVIYTELDKENNYKFSFKAGAIENPKINECIVKVLEGAMPAFNKRKLKYYENI